MARGSQIALLLLCSFAAFAAAAPTPLGIGSPCKVSPGVTPCLTGLTCATWIEGGRCCAGGFQVKEGDYCNLGSGVCCTDEFDCKSNKCVKKGPPPCASFAGIGEYCDLNAGKCCGGNRIPCTSNRCISSTPTPPALPACKNFAGIGESCDPGKGDCCGGNAIPCVSGRCVSRGRKLME